MMSTTNLTTVKQTTVDGRMMTTIMRTTSLTERIFLRRQRISMFCRSFSNVDSGNVHLTPSCCSYYQISLQLKLIFDDPLHDGSNSTQIKNLQKLALLPFSSKFGVQEVDRFSQSPSDFGLRHLNVS